MKLPLVSIKDLIKWRCRLEIDLDPDTEFRILGRVILIESKILRSHYIPPNKSFADLLHYHIFCQQVQILRGYSFAQIGNLQETIQVLDPRVDRNAKKLDAFFLLYHG